MENNIDLNSLKAGLVIGLDADDRLVISQIGTTSSNYMELLGLAYTAVDMIKLYRDQSLPSLLTSIRTMLAETMELQRLQEKTDAES